MINFIVSRYEQDTSWVAKYAPSMILYDRSDNPVPGSIIVPNLGSDLADKFHFIITNYNNLPPVAVYTKANLFKYISQPEFDKVKNNSWFTPLLTMNHKETKFDGTEEYIQKHGIDKDVSFYKDGIYWEINNMWYLNQHPIKHDPKEIQALMGIDKMEYVPFAPGSNYILTAEDIRRHPVEFYIKLYNYLTWAVYPGEAQVIERGLYTIFR